MNFIILEYNFVQGIKQKQNNFPSTRQQPHKKSLEFYFQEILNSIHSAGFLNPQKYFKESSRKEVFDMR